ncbi:MAG: hypothetical protein LDL31_10730 [Prosthecobacter sp.]|nr:hypothetical protein [Prosthecobacter sp.]
MFLTAGLTVGGLYWWYRHNFDAKPMQPVALTVQEKAALDSKLAVFGDPPVLPVQVMMTGTPTATPPVPAPAPQAAPGEENRTLVLTEREVNAYLAAQNLGENVQVSFGEGKLIAGLLVEIPPDFPLMAGQKVRVRLTFGTGLSPQHKFSFVFNDLSLGGISLPNAWLGDLKGVDLIAENLDKDPALQRFLAGIKSVEIRPGGAKVVLNE